MSAERARVVRVCARSAFVVLACCLGLVSASGCPSEQPPQPPPATPDRTSAPPQAAPEPSPAVAEPEKRVTPAPARDAEPNDDWLHAVPLIPGKPAIGLVDRPEDPKIGDQDWYVVQVPAGGPALMRATLSGADDLDVVLEWMPPDDRKDGKLKAVVQADVHERKAGSELLPNLRVEPGPVYLRVREAWYRGKKRTGSDVPYKLEVSLDRWTPDMEAEPNGSPSQATLLDLGAPGRGTLATMRDRDAWRVDIPPDLEADLVKVQLTGIEGIEMELNVSLPGDGGSITARGKAGEGITLRQIDASGARGQSLMVVVRARHGASPETAYTLQVVEEADAGDERTEREPNDARERATVVMPGPRTLGFITHPADVDTFAFEALADRTVHVLLMPPAESNLSVELLDAEGKSARRLDEGRGGEAEVMRSFGLEPGRWYLSVRGSGKDASDSSRPYALELSLGDPGRDEQEPNDERVGSRVGSLTPGTPRRGWLHPAGDVDWWKLVVGGEAGGEAADSAGEGRIVTLRAQAPDGLTLDLDVHTEAGDRVTGRAGLQAREPTTFTHFFQPGTYWLRVASSDPSASSSAAHYELATLD